MTRAGDLPRGPPLPLDAPSDVLALREVSKSFGAHEVVRSFTLNVQRGEVVALLGPNGAGKTTLLRVAAGIARPDGGEILVTGIDLVRQPRKAKRNIGWVADRPLLYDELTVAENLAFFAKLYGVPSAQAAERADGLLRQLGVGHRAADPAGSLSLGLKQRASLARALLHDPSVLLLDEPFEGLDPSGQSALMGLLRDAAARRERGVLLTTQQIDLGLQAADRVALMDRGALVRTIPKDAVDDAALMKELRGPGGNARAS